MKTIIVKEKKKIRLDKFLKKYTSISRNQIQKLIKKEFFTINNQNIKKKNYELKDLDKISFEEKTIKKYISKIYFEDKNFNSVFPEKIKLNILYEDEEIIVINKPSGMIVHPGIGNNNGTLMNGIKYYNPNFNKLKRGGLLHRLDKDTSGLLILAKNNEIYRYISKQFKYRSIERKYIALVCGNLKKNEGSITGFIGRNIKNRKKMTIFKSEKQGKYSITFYKVLKRFKYLTLLLCTLGTGRTHQIRTHLKYLGYPIFNDSIYTNKKSNMRKNSSMKETKFIKNCTNIMKRQALHATYISFIHPKKGKISFNCPIPIEFKKILNFLKKKSYNKIPCNNI